MPSNAACKTLHERCRVPSKHTAVGSQHVLAAHFILAPSHFTPDRFKALFYCPAHLDNPRQ